MRTVVEVVVVVVFIYSDLVPALIPALVPDPDAERLGTVGKPLPRLLGSQMGYCLGKHTIVRMVMFMCGTETEKERHRKKNPRCNCLPGPCWVFKPDPGAEAVGCCRERWKRWARRERKKNYTQSNSA